MLDREIFYFFLERSLEKYAHVVVVILLFACNNFRTAKWIKKIILRIYCNTG
jgi:hypothetical protein